MKGIIICIEILFSLLWLSCNGQPTVQKSAVQKEQAKEPINCYILKPIKKNVEYHWIDKLSFSNSDMSASIRRIIAGKKIKMDTSMSFLTSFEYQKKILINTSCFLKLNNPDDMGLVNIYFYSRLNTSTMLGSNIEFTGYFEKNILNFGHSLVYEYRFRNVSMVEPHFFHIILLKKENNSESKYDDYAGIIICSDGIDWEKISDNNDEVTPIHLTNLREGVQIKSPLIFDSDQFIPIGHFKGQW